MALAGVFEEVDGDSHVSARQQVLRRKAWYPSPPGPVVPTRTATNLAGIVADLRIALDCYGVGVVQVDEALTNAAVIAVASSFGVPQQQSDPRLAPWVEDDVLLNLRADSPEVDDREWELLFAENYVMFHSELAFREVRSQVRHLFFQCAQAPKRDEGGQTLLASMSGVSAALSPLHRRILRSTFALDYSDPPPFLSDVDGWPVVSFKDTEGTPLPWRYEGARTDIEDGGEVGIEIGVEQINDAIRALHAAVYDESAVVGIPWSPHLLAAFDNRRYLHARSISPTPPGWPRRHLREVRTFDG